MKKLLFALSLLVATMTQAQVKQYDVNGNEDVTIGDITIVVAAAQPGSGKQADVNRDGKTDLQDVKAITHYMNENVGGYDYVDLDLPSGNLWATCNVGAEKPEDYGSYFAWGETTTKDSYKWSNYAFSNDGNIFTKYNTSSEHGEVDNKTTLDVEDDAAAQIWGHGWQIPTNDDINELRSGDHCTWTKATINGVIGYVVKSKKNNNSIFLPLGGYIDGTTHTGIGNSGCYWSSTLNAKSVWTAHNMVIDNSNFLFCNLRYYGRNIRAVLKPQQP